MRAARTVLSACAQYRTRRLLIQWFQRAPVSTRSSQGRALNSSLAVDSYPPEHPAASPEANIQPIKDPLPSITPIEQYHKLLESGVLHGDGHQIRIIRKLQDLHDKLLHYTPPPISSPAPLTSFVSRTDIRWIHPSCFSSLQGFYPASRPHRPHRPLPCQKVSTYMAT